MFSKLISSVPLPQYCVRVSKVNPLLYPYAKLKFRKLSDLLNRQESCAFFTNPSGWYFSSGKKSGLGMLIFQGLIYLLDWCNTLPIPLLRRPCARLN